MKRPLPALIPFLVFISLVFIGILIYAYVETKKANPQMIEVGQVVNPMPHTFPSLGNAAEFVGQDGILRPSGTRPGRHLHAGRQAECHSAAGCQPAPHKTACETQSTPVSGCGKSMRDWVENLPHIGRRARLDQCRCPLAEKLSRIAPECVRHNT
jgi:hypothetical protein